MPDRARGSPLTLPLEMLVDQHGRALQVPAPSERADVDDRLDETRFDGWQNDTTQIGGWADKAKQGYFAPMCRLVDSELTDLHNGSDICAKIVDAEPDQMFRRAFSLAADGIDQSAADDLLDEMNESFEFENELEEGAKWGRNYGGLLLIMLVQDGRQPWEPLDETRIRSFDGLTMVDRRYAYPRSFYADMGLPKYGKPETYLISNAVATSTSGAVRTASELTQRGGSIALVHESRCIRFDGNSSDVRSRQVLNGWTWSTLQRPYDVVRSFDHAFDTVGHLLSDASQSVFKLKGLMNAIASKQSSQVQARMRAIEQSRSAARAIVIDESESWERQETPLGGIADLLDRFMLRVSAAADAPRSEIFGESPGGLNASGNADSMTRKWYDKIAKKQRRDVGPKIRRIVKIRSLAANSPIKLKKSATVRWTVNFAALWEPTDKESADTAFALAQADCAYIAAGVVTPEEVALERQDLYSHMDTESREAALTGAKKFDPYENDEEDPSAGAGAGGGEPGAAIGPGAAAAAALVAAAGGKALPAPKP